ncbi:T-complex protein 1 subunit zeta-like [Chiloscyllium plagiosum]|uniref:T-complex protein 1 subunit zeta-like n=1 Tax=Chiloscyllium plagiosum TaxID=36176 RepID=UPI001CB7FD4E|nr:T-complex protein 1 subunit zeta-like [Chiloscyllium plagiosum]
MALKRKAETALSINVCAARALQELLRSNLGPKGTMKMLVSGAGDIRLTKDGGVLLREMQLQHPTASFIAKAVAAMDETVGDGTTSAVLIIGEILKQAHRYISEGVHPRVIVEGLELAKEEAISCLDELWEDDDGFIRQKVARTSLGTKVHSELADLLADLVVEAVHCVYQHRQPIDLNLVEIMEMQQQTECDTVLIKGLVLDHGARHPDMKKRVENAYILTLNVSLEYEKTEVNSGFFYKSVEERERLVKAERQFIEERVRAIIALKRKVCGDSDKGFVVVNQKGIDPLSLELFVKEGIVALRRAKRRNLERLPLACGGLAVNSVEELTEEYLGHAGLVYEQTLGDRKYTFIEKCDNPQSVTLLIKGPNKHTMTLIKDAIRDGMRAVKCTIEDGAAMPGGGAVEIRIGSQLLDYRKGKVKGHARFGFQAFADAILIIPKTLAQNAGYDPQEIVSNALSRERETTLPVRIDLSSGELINDWETPIWDSACVKHQLIHTCTAVASNLLLVDEIVGTGMISDKK